MRSKRVVLLILDKARYIGQAANLHKRLMLMRTMRAALHAELDSLAGNVSDIRLSQRVDSSVPPLRRGVGSIGHLKAAYA